ncbi:MAG: DUF1707 domain-containing protein [Streptosporangiaceae bacterium]
MSEPAMLASDADRDGTVRVLNEAFTDGRLTAGEHHGRLDAAYAAQTWPELAVLTADLPRRADPAAEPAAPDWTGSLDPCLLCLLFCLCPPAGLAVLLHRRRPRARTAHRAEDR